LLDHRHAFEAFRRWTSKGTAHSTPTLLLAPLWVTDTDVRFPASHLSCRTTECLKLAHIPCSPRRSDSVCFRRDFCRVDNVVRRRTPDPSETLAAKFAVMHNPAQTAMMCSVELGHAMRGRPRHIVSRSCLNHTLRTSNYLGGAHMIRGDSSRMSRDGVEETRQR